MKLICDFLNAEATGNWLYGSETANFSFMIEDQLFLAIEKFVSIDMASSLLLVCFLAVILKLMMLYCNWLFFFYFYFSILHVYILF